MAKDKNKEAEYKAIGLGRIAVRKQNRLNNWTSRVYKYGRGTQKCEYCGNNMSWCGTCQVWSSSCCIDYGTCQCS